MHLFTNTTSPFARIVRIALREKGLTDTEERIVNPWADDAGLMAANSAARVPVLVTDNNENLSESLLILLWLEKQFPSPALLAGNIANALQVSGIAFGVLEAAVHSLVGRVICGPTFDDAPVGLRRRRTILTGLQQLEENPPEYTDGLPDLSAILAVVTLDYVFFRFAEQSWLKQFPRLNELKERLSNRASFKETFPFV